MSSSWNLAVLALSCALLAVVAEVAGVQDHPANFEKPFKAFKAPDVELVIDSDLGEWPDAKCFTFWPDMDHKKLPEWCLENWLVDQAFGDKFNKRTKFESVDGGMYRGLHDHSNAVAFSWDAENFYVRAHIHDDEFQSHCGQADTIKEGDSMQVAFTDEARSEVKFVYNFALFLDVLDECDVETHIEYEKQPLCGDDENDQQACGARAPIQAEVSREEDYNWTTYEVKIPAAWVGMESFSAGQKLGVAVSVNDGDRGHNQEGKKGWGGVSPDAIQASAAEKALLVVLDANIYEEGKPPMKVV